MAGELTESVEPEYVFPSANEPEAVPLSEAFLAEERRRLAAQRTHLLPKLPRFLEGRQRFAWDEGMVADVCGALAVLFASLLYDASIEGGEGTVQLEIRAGGQPVLLVRPHPGSERAGRQGNADPVEISAGEVGYELRRGLGLGEEGAACAWRDLAPLLKDAPGALSGIAIAADAAGKVRFRLEPVPANS